MAKQGAILAGCGRGFAPVNIDQAIRKGTWLFLSFLMITVPF